MSDPASALDAGRELRRFLDRLSVAQREVFVGHEILGLAAPELSASLGLSVNTVYSRLRLAREKFARLSVDPPETACDEARHRRIWAGLCAYVPSLGAVPSPALLVSSFVALVALTTAMGTAPPQNVHMQSAYSLRGAQMHEGPGRRDADRSPLLSTNDASAALDRSAASPSPPASAPEKKAARRGKSSTAADPKQTRELPATDERGSNPPVAAEPPPVPAVQENVDGTATDPSRGHAVPRGFSKRERSDNAAPGLAPKAAPPPRLVRPSVETRPHTPPPPKAKADRPQWRAPVTATPNGAGAAIPVGRVIDWARRRRG